MGFLDWMRRKDGDGSSGEGARRVPELRRAIRAQAHEPKGGLYGIMRQVVGHPRCFSR
jgi:hypothetical protein